MTSPKARSAHTEGLNSQRSSSRLAQPVGLQGSTVCSQTTRGGWASAHLSPQPPTHRSQQPGYLASALTLTCAVAGRGHEDSVSLLCECHTSPPQFLVKAQAHYLQHTKTAIQKYQVTKLTFFEVKAQKIHPYKFFLITPRRSNCDAPTLSGCPNLDLKTLSLI